MEELVALTGNKFSESGKSLQNMLLPLLLSQKKIDIDSNSINSNVAAFIEVLFRL